MHDTRVFALPPGRQHDSPAIASRDCLVVPSRPACVLYACRRAGARDGTNARKPSVTGRRPGVTQIRGTKYELGLPDVQREGRAVQALAQQVAPLGRRRPLAHALVLILRRNWATGHVPRGAGCLPGCAWGSAPGPICRLVARSPGQVCGGWWMVRWLRKAIMRVQNCSVARASACALPPMPAT
jgi:hypothetical protein